MVELLLQTRSNFLLRFADAAKDRFPPILLKKSPLRCGKSFDSLSNEEIGGFGHDGNANGPCSFVL